MAESADRVSSHVFSPKAVFGQDRKSRSAKEYINVWHVIHYLDFDSVAP